MAYADENILNVYTQINVDTIAEYTTNAGTTVGGVRMLSSAIRLADVTAPANPGAGFGNLYKKTANDGIFWKPDAAGAEVDLTAPQTLDDISPTTTKGDIIVDNGTTCVRLPSAGVNGYVLSVANSSSTGLSWLDPATLSSGLMTAIVRDIKTNSTNGGTFTSGAWQTRALNNYEDSDGGTTTSPSSTGLYLNTSLNRVTIPPGTYMVIGYSTAFRVDNNQVRLQQVGLANTVSVLTTSATGLGGTYFRISSPTINYYVWYDTGGSTNPAAANPGRTGIQVTVGPTNTADQVAAATELALHNSAGFTCSNPRANELYIRNKDAGAPASAATAGTTSFTVTTTTTGRGVQQSLYIQTSSGATLGGTYFRLSSTTVNYYVWYDTGGSTNPAAANPGRTGIQVNILVGDTNSQVASKTQLALNGAIFTVTNPSSNNVYLTNVVAGTPLSPYTIGSIPSPGAFAIYNLETLALGMSNFCGNSTNGTTTTSSLNAILTLTSTVVVEFQHRCSRTQTGNGFGNANGFGQPNELCEIYTNFIIQRIKTGE